MATLNDPAIQELLEQPNHGVISTLNPDGSVHNAVVWVAPENGTVTVNSAEGRVWPSNLERDPRTSVLVMETGNGGHYVEIRGTAERSSEGADEHINQLSQKYIGKDQYPFRRPGEERVKFVIRPEHVRHVDQ